MALCGFVVGRLAYAATAPELIERFPQRVDGVELARKYLLALLPLSESLGPQGLMLFCRAFGALVFRTLEDIRHHQIIREPHVFEFAFQSCVYVGLWAKDPWVNVAFGRRLGSKHFDFGAGCLQPRKEVQSSSVMTINCPEAWWSRFTGI